MTGTRLAPSSTLSLNGHGFIMALTDISDFSPDFTHGLARGIGQELQHNSLGEFAVKVHDLAANILAELGIDDHELLTSAKIGACWDALIEAQFGSHDRKEFKLLATGLLLYRRWLVERKQRNIHINASFADYLGCRFSGDDDSAPCASIGRSSSGEPSLRKLSQNT